MAPLGRVYVRPDIKPVLAKANVIINPNVMVIKNNVAIDIVEIDIRNAWEHLGEIIGANYNEELLDNLFSNFCLGK